MIKKIALITVIIAFSAATGCESRWLPPYYRIDIRQGNYVDQEMIDQLQPGMSKSQVQFLMGTPLIMDPFHPDRWDYYYSFRRDGKQKDQYRVSLFFQGNVLARVDKGAGFLQ